MPGSGPALRPAALPGSGCSSAAAPLHLITNGAASHAAASLLLQIAVFCRLSSHRYGGEYYQGTSKEESGKGLQQTGR